MQKRPPAITTADHWCAPMPDLLEHWAVKQTSIFPVEGAVAQHDAFGRARLGNASFEIPDGSERARKFRGRVGVERISFRFYRATDAGIGPAAKALGKEALDAGLSRCRQQMVGALSPQSIARGEGTVECEQFGGCLQIGYLQQELVRTCAEVG